MNEPLCYSEKKEHKKIRLYIEATRKSDDRGNIKAYSYRGPIQIFFFIII